MSYSKLAAVAAVVGSLVIGLAVRDACADKIDRYQHPIQVEGEWEDPEFGTLSWKAGITISNDVLVGVVDVVGHPDLEGGTADIEGSLRDGALKLDIVLGKNRRVRVFDGLVAGNELEGSFADRGSRAARGRTTWEMGEGSVLTFSPPEKDVTR